MPKLIALVGLPGSGKTEAVNYIMQKFGWPKIYFADGVFEELEKRGLQMNQKNEKLVRESLREKYGPACLAVQVAEKIDRMENEKIIVLESLYSLQEFMFLKEKYGDDLILIAIYAPPRMRYERLVKRPIRPLTVEEARGRDYAQIENLSQAGPIAMADYTIINDGNLENLHSQIDKVIKKPIR